MKIRAWHLVLEGGLHPCWGCRDALPSPALPLAQLSTHALASSLPSKVFFPFSPVFWGSQSYSVQYPVSLLLLKQFASSALTTPIPGSQLVAHWYCQSKKIMIWATARHGHHHTPTCMWDVFDASFELELLSFPHLQRLWWARWCKAACGVDGSLWPSLHLRTLALVHLSIWQQWMLLPDPFHPPQICPSPAPAAQPHLASPSQP